MQLLGYSCTNATRRDRVGRAGARDRRQPDRGLEHSNHRHRRRQCLLGAVRLGHEVRRLDAIDVQGSAMALECNGELVSSGAGAAYLGSPVNATLWLARIMAKAGRPLRAGDVVLSGALGPTAPTKPGAAFEARIQGLGSVRVNFGKEGVRQ